MDRLVCGDVGFGKTEVALRAAFKVVDAGRQVAVLVPTTILCRSTRSDLRRSLRRSIPFTRRELEPFPAARRRSRNAIARGARAGTT
jgi:transcription-repair coupling factor (superfamily II helicase)